MTSKQKFQQNPSINPKTGLPVVIGSKEFIKLTEKYGNVTIYSPKTSSKIAIGKGEYKKLLKTYTESELIALIGKPKGKIELDVLSLLKLHDIDYISHLSYMDMLNLCYVNKNLSHLCSDNQLLRNIVIRKDNIVLPPNIDIVTPLNLIYKQINQLVYENFTSQFIPTWINKDAFLKSMQKRILYLFINKLYLNLTSIFNGKNKKFKILITKSYLSFPFVGDNFNINNTIILTPPVINYISPTIDAFYKTNPQFTSSDIIQALYDLFFTNFDIYNVQIQNL